MEKRQTYRGREIVRDRMSERGRERDRDRETETETERGEQLYLFKETTSFRIEGNNIKTTDNQINFKTNTTKAQ